MKYVERQRGRDSRGARKDRPLATEALEGRLLLNAARAAVGPTEANAAGGAAVQVARLAVQPVVPVQVASHPGGANVAANKFPPGPGLG
jgi:hypothetical protein